MGNLIQMIIITTIIGVSNIANKVVVGIVFKLLYQLPTQNIRIILGIVLNKLFIPIKLPLMIIFNKLFSVKLPRTSTELR